jgi:hypothetical protein
VLADIALDVAELVGKEERLAVLAQRCPPVLVERMIGMVKKPSFIGYLCPKSATRAT